MKSFKEFTLNEDLGLKGDSKTYIEAVYAKDALMALEFILDGPTKSVQLLKNLAKENAKYIKEQKDYMKKNAGAPGYQESEAQKDLNDDLALEKIIKKAITKI